MPRVTKASLEEENAQLRSRNSKLSQRVYELGEEVVRLRERSRSPRRMAAPLHLTQAALGVVSKHFLHDPVVDELREVIREQQETIAALRRGEGPIGEVLLANQRKIGETPPAYYVDMMLRRGKSVGEVLQEFERRAKGIVELSRWGDVTLYV